mgnify:CR=1 FL=1
MCMSMVGEIDTNFIDGALADVDSEICTQRRLQSRGLYKRESKIKMKKEAEEKLDNFMKRKNGIAAERDSFE